MSLAMDNKREAYEAPSVMTIGTLANLTLGGKTGAFTDAAFPVHTPYGSITLS